MRLLCTAAILALTLAACGSPEPAERAAPGQAASTSPTPEPSAPDRSLYEANSTVLETKKKGPMLCVGGMLDSLPPQCGDIPVEGWDWDAVDGEERMSGVTWGGDYHVVGHFDGDTFSLARPPGPPQPKLYPPDDFSSQPFCDEPPGGWIDEGDGIDQFAAGELLGPIRRLPEYAAGWVTQLEPPREYDDLGPVVLNAAFTENVEEHRADLDRRWPGSLCVTKMERTLDELQRIQDGLLDVLEEIDAQMLSSGIDEIRNRVDLHVVHLDAEQRAELEARHPPDVLVVTTALVPVDRD